MCTDTTVTGVVACASRYVAGLEQDLASVVGSEKYMQQAPSDARGRNDEQSHLERSVSLLSDFLIVKPPSSPGWLPFRDVLEVNDKPVRNRAERLTQLFSQSPRTAFAEARRIMDEGARFNLGPYRNINVPTLALSFLEPDRLPRITVTKGGDKRIDRTLCWAIDFHETGRPTVVRSPGNTDVPASGTLWIDPATGRLYQTYMKVPYGGTVEESTVMFRNDARLNSFVPVEMTEMVMVGGRVVVKGRASYSDFKRFQVSTSEVVKP